MDTLTLLSKRQSLRVYDNKPVPADVRKTVLEAAVSAPTAGALMLYSIIEIEDQSIKEKLSRTCDNQPFIAKAPWLVLFAADYQRLYDSWIASGSTPSRKPSVGDFMLACNDALIAAQTAVVAAEAVGLGSCYIGDIVENAEQHKELLNLPDYVFPTTLLCFGYAPEGYTRKKTPRLPLETILHRDGYEKKKLAESDLLISQNGLRKFEAEFSLEMTRSIGVWLNNWKG